MSVAESASDDSSRAEAFWALGRRIAQLGTEVIARIQFLDELSRQLLDFSDGVAVNLWMADVDQGYYWLKSRGVSADTLFLPLERSIPTEDLSGSEPLEYRIQELLGRLDDGANLKGSLCRSLQVHDHLSQGRFRQAVHAGSFFGTLLAYIESPMLLLPIRQGTSLSGLLVLCVSPTHRFHGRECAYYEQIAETIGRAVINRRAKFRLQERIKELTCLHGIAQLVQQDATFDTVMQSVAALLPPAMQFPDIAAARIVLDDREFSTEPQHRREHHLTEAIRIGRRSRGFVEVSYARHHPEFAIGPFLHEERDLLRSVAHEIANFVERSEAASARASLAEQLRHADRLATIGQLAAGVAHELNEPLGNIMGFAQLLQKCAGLPAAALRDADQIVQATLHGREIVKKLLLFSRQSDGQRVPLDLNTLIRESIYFLDARCRRGGIHLLLDLAEAPIFIVAVPSEITQVLVNLTVNAIQAMPGGGVLTIRSRVDAGSALLTVEDTGCGMDEPTQLRLFTPFFTTKDVGEGTGLGLSVVLGIVSAHGGTIHVQSALNRGSRFEIRLPAADAESAPMRTS